MSRQKPEITTIEKDKHYRVTNHANVWINVELIDWESGFRSISNLAPGAYLDFFPTAASKSVEAHWTLAKDANGQPGIGHH
jgi:hypothetical protein